MIAVFITALSNFDEAIAHLASHSWKIFSHPNVEKGMTEFIKGQLAKQKTSLLSFAPTPEKPEIKINFSRAPYKDWDSFYE